MGEPEGRAPLTTVERVAERRDYAHEELDRLIAFCDQAAHAHAVAEARVAEAQADADSWDEALAAVKPPESIALQAGGVVVHGHLHIAGETLGEGITSGVSESHAIAASEPPYARQCEEALDALNEQEAAIRARPRTTLYGQDPGSVYGDVDGNGRPVLIDVIVARANLLAALVRLSQ